MGEVGTNSPTDNASVTMKMNGINGTVVGRPCDDGTGDDEQMDVDSQDSSVTSGSALSHNDGKSAVNDEILAIKNRIAATTAAASTTTAVTDVRTNDGDTEETPMSQDEGEDDDEDRDDDEDDEEDDGESAAAGGSNHSENSRSDDVHKNGNKDEDENDSLAGDGDGGGKDDEDEDCSKDSTEQKNLSIEKVTTAEVEEATQDSVASSIEAKNPLEDDADEAAAEAKDSVDSAPKSPETGRMANGRSEGDGSDGVAAAAVAVGVAAEGSPADDESRDDDYDEDEDNDDVQHVPIVQEVHSISDSDDDEEVTVTKTIAGPASVKAAAAAAAAAVKTSPMTPANGHKSAAADPDDAPVSIHSDSDSESEAPSSVSAKIANERTPSKNGKKSTDAVAANKDASDNEDCVLVEDDKEEDEKKEEDISPRRSARARKSVVKVRDFSAFDDDIEEVAEDPLLQPAAKKAKKSPGPGFTIQDARSLASDPLMNVTPKNVSFQQQFINQTGALPTNNTKKEPTLVIIDTNQIMQRGNNSLSPSSFGLRAASITPINKSPPKTGSLLSSQSNLLPALTDDMFVLEAPSFIVPYIYEKPPAGNLKEIVEQIGKDLEEKRKRDEEQRKLKGETSGADETSKDASANASDSGVKTAEDAADDAKNNKKKSKKRRTKKSGDDSWDESDESTDDEASDGEERTKVLIKEVKDDFDVALTPIIVPKADPLGLAGANKDGVGVVKRESYFESPLGLFFMDIGINLVQEHVQTDLLRQQKKKLNREGDRAAPSVQMAINSLMKNLELSKDKNGVFKFENKRCEFCNFKSESTLAMAHHYETPHLINQLYQCNFCKFQARPPYDILFHMEAMHNIKARLEKGQSYHQCPNCPFEDNGKSKLARHALVCTKKFRPEINLNPPIDWEPPAKIPRIKPRHGLVGTATAYQVSGVFLVLFRIFARLD